MLRCFRSLVIMTLACFLSTCASLPVDTLPENFTYYDTITIDLVYTDDSPLTQESMTFFSDKMREYKIAKHTKFILRKVPRPLTIPWNTALLRIFETQHRRMYDSKPKDKHLVLFISCVPGPYIQGTRTNLAGLKYSSTSFAMFTDHVFEHNQGILLLHEFGHIVELVDCIGRGEKPIKPDRPSHCNDDSCNMFWRIRSSSKDYCYKCLKDLCEMISDRNSQ